jgi:hypothetical protein
MDEKECLSPFYNLNYSINNSLKFDSNFVSPRG